MSPGTMQHIFDPFFTTKKKGQGTGLGLSAVHGIILSYGGAITVKSEPGKGSTFEVFLPRLENGAAEKELAGEPIQRGSERILLIDDEVDLADMLRTSLEQLGYTVAPYNSGEKALEAFRAGPEKFDLILTDQVMPDMTGIDLAREILSTRPGIPVILLTGFGMGATASRAKAAGITEYLAKPASTRVLSAAIRRCLEKRPQPKNGNKS
jgi:CheY-like chemotaxis protein